MIDALYRSLGSLRAWVTFIIGAVAATATWRSPSRANAAAPLGAASSSLSHRKHTLPLLALLAAAALGLALLLPGGVLQAQDSGTIEYPENGKDPVATFTADDPESATSIAWSLAADTSIAGVETDDIADAGDFAIDPKTGELTFAIGGTAGASPDYENPVGSTAGNTNTYRVVVLATDNATPAAVGYHKVTVKVTDVDEPGKVSWTTDANADGTADDPALVQFQVGALLTASVTDGDIAGTDKDVQTASAAGTPGATAPIWLWYRSPSKTATGTLIEDQNTNAYTVGLDDVGMYLRVEARYVVTGNVDQETASLTSDYPVLATRIGDNSLKFDPDDIDLSVAEGDKGATVGTVTATGNHGAVNYELVAGGDAANFDIDQETGQITTAVDLDYEAAVGNAANCATTQNECSVTVRATDASGSATAATADSANNIFMDATVTIEIDNVDEKPTFVSDGSTADSPESITRAENMTALADSGSEVNVTYTATDPEGRGLTYHLMGPDGTKFQLSTNRVLSFKAKPDYENPTDANGDNVYEVTVRASDGTTNGDRMVRVTVTNVDEAPEITGMDSVNYAENGEDPVATFTATDPEGSTGITWSLATDASIDGVETDDVADNGDFVIDAETGELTFAIGGTAGASPDYENPVGSTAGNTNTYSVVVLAADDAATPNTGYHKVTVKVTNVNEPGKATWSVVPATGGTASDPTLVQFQVGAVLTVSVTDGDIAGATKDVGAAQNPTWRWYRGGTQITGQTTNTYTVDNADARHQLRVIATYRVGSNVNQETASLTSAYPVLAARIPANALKFEPSTVSREVPEGKKGANVGAPVTATGNHGAMNYTLVGTDAANFKIDAKTGQITTAVDLNFEAGAGTAGNCSAANACVVTVSATDASGDLSDPTATVNIKITDVDEKPTFSTADPAIGSTAVEVNEGETVLDATTPANVTYTATDPDGLNVNLTLTGPDAARFTRSNAGVLSFRAKPDYENPTDANRDNVYEVTVRASDGTLHTDRMVRVTVVNVNEAPMIIAGGLVVRGPASTSYEENDTAAVATYTAAGPDAALATWSLSGADSGDFTITGGVLSFRTSPDYERPADADTNNVYEVTVTANDSTNTAERDVTVTVTDADDPDPISGYDANNDGSIDESEVRAAIRDHLINQTITEDVVRGVIRLYFGL